MKKLFTTACFTGLTLLGSVAGPLLGTAEAAAKVRYQVNQNGDFLLLGQAMGTECTPSAMVPPPIVGTIGACGFNQEDASMDAYWRSDSPAVGQCTANINITTDQARTTSTLVLPAGAVVTKAFLYWSARIDQPTPQKPAFWDPQVTLDRQGGFSTVVNADDHYEFLHLNPAQGNQYAYMSIADVTTLVQTQGVGTYRLSDMDMSNIVNVFNSFSYSAWWMVVMYTRPGDPFRNITLLDQFLFVGDTNQTTLNFDTSGFFVPNVGKEGKLGVMAVAGDDIGKDDALKFNGNLLSNAENPIDNFFNGSRSHLGAKVSNVGDLPLLPGGANSLAGLDLDVIDIAPYLAPGNSTAQITTSTIAQDGYFPAAFVTSISTSTPDFTSSTKTASDLNGGLALPGDVIEYTLLVNNTGNDASVSTKITDVIPAGLTFVPGSIQITAGPNLGVKTDAAGDDQAEYDAAAHTLTVRVGTGADMAAGGSLGLAATTAVKFKVTVEGGTLGTINNQAFVSASGQSGAAATSWATDGNGNAAGAPATPIFVDECLTDVQCPMNRPRCVTGPNPNLCVECTSNVDCADPTPTCNLPTNTCGCVPTGPEVCGNDVDEDCNGTVCECATDAQCGGPTSGQVCSGSNTCIDGCRGLGGNGCAAPAQCTSVSNAIGQCVGCLVDANCGGQESGKVCDPQSHACEDGCRGLNGNGCMLGSVCTSANASIGVCVSCIIDAHCGDAMSGQVCNQSTFACEPGCRGMNGNGCPAGSVCSSFSGAVGDCVQCVADPDCGGPTSAKVCDVDTNTCGDGCRGSGGNGCAAGSVCTSTDVKVGTCVQCLKDADCGGPESAKLCDVVSRTCKDGCRGTGGNGCPSDSVCTSPDSSPGKCVQCLKDADCGAAKSGLVCNTANKTCIPGCRGMNGNGCPDGKTCTSINGTIGSCGCEEDKDCGTVSSGRVCDAATLECIDGCRGAGGNHCADGVTCSSIDDSIGACGCTMDAECGATDSGRVCDAATKACADGCRGSGGNTCASGGTCSSTNGDIGTCAKDELVGQGHGIFCSTRPGDDRSSGAPWLFGSAVSLLLALRRRRRAA